MDFNPGLLTGPVGNIHGAAHRGDFRSALSASEAMNLAFDHFPFAVLVVDDTLRVLHHNRAAEAIMVQPCSGLAIKADVLTIRHARSAEPLLRLVERACNGQGDAAAGLRGDLLIGPGESDDDGLGLIVSVGPLLHGGAFGPAYASHAVLFIRELTLDLPENFSDHVRSLFALSPKEAQIATALAAGRSLKEAAAMHNVRFTTARSYLENIFRKTGVRQQSQLVALLKTAQPLAGPR